MKLLVFAHKGEASHFILKLNFKPKEFVFPGLYSNGQDLLLLTGEGIQNATERSAIVLATFSKNINKIINIGIAGSLDINIPVNQIKIISESYKESNESIEPKKFKFNESGSSWRCVSANDRVLDLDYAQRLARHADIVDRELWAIASCAKLFQLPVSAIKLISDNTLQESHKEQCQDIKALAKKMSESLFDFYQNSQESK